jgi:hypothetical protein
MQVHFAVFSQLSTLNDQLLGGGKGIRTPDFQLAKLALYQLSYAPNFGLPTFALFADRGKCLR